MDYRLLGPVAVRDGRDELNLGGRRPRLLLAMLLLHPNAPVSRSTLIEGLWGDEPPARAATAVRVVLAQLRRVLEPDRGRGQPSILTHGSAGWVLTVPAGAVDAERFETLVDRSRQAYETGDLERASTLGRAALAEWRGPALVDVVDDLAIAQAPARRWEELRLETTERTIESELRLGRHDALTGELTGLVSAHPLREHLVSLLIVALYRGGRQAEALRVYEQARRRLVEELGLEPTTRLAGLERAILLQEPVLEGPDPKPSPTAVEARPAAPLPGAVLDSRRTGRLFGREAELARVGPILDDVAAGRAATLVVSGVAGIGKTRFAAEVAATAHQRGALVLCGRCDRESLISYQPFVEALGEYAGQLTGEAAGRVSEILATLTGARARVGDETGEARDAADRYLLFESVAELLRELAGGRMLVLVVDDLQWADGGTLALTRHLVRRLHDRPILLVLTTRHADGPVPAYAERDGHLHRLPLAGLGEDASLAVLTHLWADEPNTPPPGAPRLIGLAEGNPFFLRHLGAHLLAAGPEAADPEHLTLPTEVSSLVETVVGSLSHHARLLLQIASVQGRDFDLDVVGAVAGMDDGILLDAGDELLAARLVVDDVSGGADRYRFAHELVREVCYRQITPSRRARLHSQVGVALETIDDTQLLALSHHFALAGRREWPKAAGYARRAGDRAMAALAFDTAIAQYERAERLARSVHRTGRGYVELLIALGCARLAAGRTARGRATLREATDLARRRDLPELVGLAALVDAGDTDPSDRSGTGAYIAQLEEILTGLTDEHATIRARVASRLASVVLTQDGAAAADRPSADALRLAREQRDPGALADALHVRHLVLMVEEPPQFRLELADEQLRCAARGSDADIANALWDRTIDVMELGLRDETDTMLGAYRRWRNTRAPIPWWGEVFAGTVATARGDLDGAEHHVFAACELGRELDQRDAHPVFVGQLFVLRWLQGRLDEVGAVLDTLTPADTGEVAWWAGSALRRVEEGDAAGAAHELDRLMTFLDRLPDAYVRLGSLAIAAEAAARLGPAAAGPARRLLDRLRPYAGRHLVFLPGIALLGPCDRYLGGLLAACGRPDEAAAALGRAATMADAAGTAPYAARARAAIRAIDPEPVARDLAQSGDERRG